MVSPWALVGRGVELEFVATQLADRSSGGVVVAGLPGVGKSRLVREALGRLPRGVASTLVAATRAAATIPFGPFTALVPGFIPAPTGELEFFQRAMEAITNRGRGRPMVLAVDDAHLLDSGSAALLHQLVADHRVKVACTVAARASAPDAIVALWKDDLTARLELQPLSLDETTALVEGALGATVDSASMRRLWEAAAGNPLLVRELVDHAEASGDLHFSEGAWRSTWPVTGSIWLERILTDRLGELSGPERHLLELLAVGEPVEPDVLLDLTSPPALESLEARGMVVIERADTGAEMVRLAQAVRADIVSSTLSFSSKQDRRGELARALLARSGQVGRGELKEGAESPATALRIATLGFDVPDISLGPELLTKAALAANARWAWGEGEQFARAAIEAGAGPEASWALVVAICHGSSDALTELARLPLDVLDAKHQAMLAAGQVEILTERGRLEDAEKVMEQALRTIPDPAGCDFVRATWAMVLSTAGHDAEAADIAVPLVDNPATDELVRLRAAATAMYGWVRNGELDRARLRMAELLPSAFAQADQLPAAFHWVGGSLLIAELMAGHLDAAEGMTPSGRAGSTADLSYDPQDWAALAVGRIALLRGDVRRAQRLLATVLVGPDWLVGLEQAWAWALLAESRALLGDETGAKDAMERADANLTRGSSRYLCDIDRSRPWVAVAKGELSAATDLARVALIRARDRGDRYFELWSLHELIRLGGAKEAAPALLALAPQIDGEWPAAFSVHARSLISGDGDGLLVAADHFEAIGALVHAAEAATEASIALREAGKPARGAAAAARAAALVARCPGVRTPVLERATGLSELTRREQEVALLAVKGLSSSQIAARLVLSRRTVEGHLARAYQKLGVRRRAELAAVLAAQAGQPVPMKEPG